MQIAQLVKFTTGGGTTAPTLGNMLNLSKKWGRTKT